MYATAAHGTGHVALHHGPLEEALHTHGVATYSLRRTFPGRLWLIADRAINLSACRHGCLEGVQTGHGKKMLQFSAVKKGLFCLFFVFYSIHTYTSFILL